MPMGINEKEYAMNVVSELRMSGFKVDMDYMSRNVKSNFKQADRLKSKFVMIIGEEELKNRVLTIKNNATKEEFKIEADYLIYFFDEQLSTFEGEHDESK
jgi:histidyl-tRNA synthetase